MEEISTEAVAAIRADPVEARDAFVGVADNRVFAGDRPTVQALSWRRSRRSAVATMRRAILLKIGAWKGKRTHQ
jgi:hypothetical protein